jgi:hypothetical protein
MGIYQDIIEKILQEVDEDIKTAMLKSDGKYKAYEMIPDPANAIINWQIMRNKNAKRSAK